MPKYRADFLVKTVLSGYSDWPEKWTKPCSRTFIAPNAKGARIKAHKMCREMTTGAKTQAFVGAMAWREETRARVKKIVLIKK